MKQNLEYIFLVINTELMAFRKSHLAFRCLRGKLVEFLQNIRQELS